MPHQHQLRHPAYRLISLIYSGSPLQPALTPCMIGAVLVSRGRMKVHLSTLGCRLNQGEIDSMARQFAHRGDEIVTAAEDADLFVVNTCAVTQEATRSSRQLIYRLHRASPDAKIAVTGCYSNIARKEAASLPGVTHVVDNLAKESLVS